MTASAVDRNTPALYLQRQNRIPLATSAVIPAGVMVGVNASGLAPTAGSTDAAGLIIIGRSEHAASQTAGDTDVTVSRGVMGLAGSSALVSAGQAMVGRKVYVVDNVTVGVAADSTNKVVAGVLEEIEGSVFYVSLGVGEQYASGAIDGADATVIADASVSPTSTQGGVAIVFPILLPDAATATYVYKTTDKIEIIDVLVIKDGAGAANTIQVTDSADAAISNAIAAAVDKTVTRAGTLDIAKRVVAAGGTFKLVNTRAAGSSAASVFVTAIKRA